ncbi:MAG: apolipoprotein N-acyltransferase [Prosthecobacter sp.]|uniref:apolipoprotein N-acyltransferase n=1 Tax=Prosthecobacter sp. TaxID=1965333 RepID=UPI0019F6FF44|nr:apolipoprotein N-acyltransferase [Prosthecobacter sp.]MBE2283034.1 apolipoprotein N-acyltransferase [Prosthecobacter sp.]
MTDLTKLRLFFFLAPLLSGIILVFAFPGWNSNLAVWLWPFPLLSVLWPWRNVDGVKVRPFWRGYLAGLAFFLPNLWWVRHSSRVIGGAYDDTWIGWGPELLGFGAAIGLSGYCAVYLGLWSWFTQRYARPKVEKLTKESWQISTTHSLGCAFLAAAAWAACEWLRSTTVFTGFGWNGLGVAMHRNLVLIQAADLVGVLGLSFLPMFVACTAWNTLTRLVFAYRGEGTCKSRLDLTVALVLLLGTAGYGMLKLTEKAGDDITVRTVLVQPNVAQVDAWTGRLAEQIYDRLDKFTRMYAGARDGKNPVDLVIWPESALPVNLNDHFHQLPEGWHTNYFDDLLHAGEFSLLTGTELHEHGRTHVSAVLFREHSRNRQDYHKLHLVPFGEYLPLGDYPPFSLLRGVIPGDFTPGTNAEPLQLMKPEVQIIPLICFEDTVGRVARKFAREAPQMIVNISNDGWFLQSDETEVHLANALFRAIELRRPMVRATNTGVTCFIDTHGRVTSRLDDPDTGKSFVEGVLPGEVQVPRQGKLTLYARFGDWFAILMLLICVVKWAVARFARPATS